MGNPRLQALRAKRDGITEKMENIDSAVALRADLALTEDESTEYEGLRAALVSVGQDIDNLSDLVTSQAHTATVLAGIETLAGDDTGHRSIVHVHESAPAPMTPGEYACTVYRASFGDAVEREEAQTILRTVQETGTADTPGILPTPIVGDLVKFVDAHRYAVAGMRSVPMPDKGKTFSRPRLTQSSQSAAQTEKSQLQSRQLTTTGDTVTKATHGTVLRLTRQDIDWSEPALLDIAYEDMAEQYAIDTEAAAAAAIAAAITSNVVSFDISTADAAATASAFSAAAVATYGTAKAMPDTIFAAVNVWGFLAGLTDDDGRPLYPNLNPVNAPGQLDLTSFVGNPMGLRLCVSPAFSDDFLAFGVSRYAEVYEQNKGFITVDVPSVLEQEIAYYGYFATNVYAKGLTGLTAS